MDALEPLGVVDSEFACVKLSIMIAAAMGRGAHRGHEQ